MVWKCKTISKVKYFWNRETKEQMLFNPEDTTGALSIEYKGERYNGCWTSRAEVIRENCDKGFVGRGEYIDRNGKVWHLNLFKSGGIWMSKADDGEEKETMEVIR